MNRACFPDIDGGIVSFISCRGWTNPRPQSVETIPIGCCFTRQAVLKEPVPMCPACEYFALLLLGAALEQGIDTVISKLVDGGHLPWVKLKP